MRAQIVTVRCHFVDVGLTEAHNLDIKPPKKLFKSFDTTS